MAKCIAYCYVLLVIAAAIIAAMMWVMLLVVTKTALAQATAETCTVHLTTASTNFTLYSLGFESTTAPFCVELNPGECGNYFGGEEIECFVGAQNGNWIIKLTPEEVATTLDSNFANLSKLQLGCSILSFILLVNLPFTVCAGIWVFSGSKPSPKSLESNLWLELDTISEPV